MKKVIKGVTYDDRDDASVLEYARRLEGKTLREALDIPRDMMPKGYTKASTEGKQGNKGAMGENVEEYYFDIHNNSKQEPDFPYIGMELKTTALFEKREDDTTSSSRKKNKPVTIRAKERLAITSINYNTILNETFETSHLWEKAKKILLMVYEYRDDTDNVFDMPYRLAAIWGIPDEDLPQIRDDWETVMQKIRDGKAEQISSRDTKYLEAATTGSGHGATVSQPNSDVSAKPRRWALKGSYMTTVINKLFEERERRIEQIRRDGEDNTLTLEELVQTRFLPYFGKSVDQLKRELGLDAIKQPKNLYARMTKAILGVGSDAEIEEFAKADVITRTIRVQDNGRIRESVSFPAIDWIEIANTEWEDSDFYRTLQRPFLFVVYRGESSQHCRLEGLTWWSCPDDALEEARLVYEDTRHRVLAGDYAHFVKGSGFDGTGSRFHVRPHGRNKEDVSPTPQGGMAGKKSFWITNRYVEEIIRGAAASEQ